MPLILKVSPFSTFICSDGSKYRRIKNYRNADGSCKKDFYEFKIKNKTCCRRGERGVKENGDCFHQTSFNHYIKASNELIYMSSMLTDFTEYLVEINDTYEQIVGSGCEDLINKKTKPIYHYARNITF